MAASRSGAAIRAGGAVAPSGAGDGQPKAVVVACSTWAATAGGEALADSNIARDVEMAEGTTTRNENPYQSSMGVLPDIQLHSTLVMNHV